MTKHNLCTFVAYKRLLLFLSKQNMEWKFKNNFAR